MKVKLVFSPEDDAFILRNYRPGRVHIGRGPDPRPGLTTSQIAAHLKREKASVVTRYHILMGNRDKRGLMNPRPVDEITCTPNTPSLFKTKFEDLDPGKYDEP